MEGAINAEKGAKQFMDAGAAEEVDEKKEEKEKTGYYEKQKIEFRKRGSRKLEFLKSIDFGVEGSSERERKIAQELWNLKELYESGNLKESKGEGRQEIELPGSYNGVLVSDFARKLKHVYKNKTILFIKTDLDSVVEISTNEDGETYFSEVEPTRFVSLIERFFVPYIVYATKDGKKKKIQSMNKETARNVLQSDEFKYGLPRIKRIFNVQQPVFYNGELTFPKEGYDSRFNSYLPPSAPKINEPNMTLEESKNLIYDLLQDFCFESHEDYNNAIAYLLTPFIRGLYSQFTTRTPLFVMTANRERAGKDFLAGLSGILMEGDAKEDPPISNGQNNSNANDELRKKVVTEMKKGRKKMHFSNNKGHINNAILESITTATKYEDRILGKSETVSLNNEIDYSLSGNIGMTMTADLTNRSRFIKLFLEIENANKRNFQHPDLHGYLKNRRQTFLSALYTLVRNWYEKGMPNGSESFASFPEWARICGGIMESADYENPAKDSSNLLGISQDKDTEEMKNFFELCYDQFPDQYITKSEMKKAINDSDEELFYYLDFEKRSDQTKFGQKIDSYVGRILSDIKMDADELTKRSARRKYIFYKKTGQEGGNVVTSGNVPQDCDVFAGGGMLNYGLKVTKCYQVTRYFVLHSFYYHQELTKILNFS